MTNTRCGCKPQTLSKHQTCLHGCICHRSHLWSPEKHHDYVFLKVQARQDQLMQRDGYTHREVRGAKTILMSSPLLLLELWTYRAVTYLRFSIHVFHPSSLQPKFHDFPNLFGISGVYQFGQRRGISFPNGLLHVQKSQISHIAYK